MAALTLTNYFRLAHIAFARRRDDLIVKLIPRRCMVISTGSVLAGLSIPLLMTVGLLPVTLFLGGVGLALAAAGGLMVFTYCGEI